MRFEGSEGCNAAALLTCKGPYNTLNCLLCVGLIKRLGGYHGGRGLICPVDCP